MAEKKTRTVLLALDGSKNSEYALNCKYKLLWFLFDYSRCFRECSADSSAGNEWGRESAKDGPERVFAKI